MKVIATIGLERCADCRKVCACYRDCTCSVIDAATAEIVCHSCADARDARF